MMHPILRNTVAVIAGLFACMIVKMLVVKMGSSVILPPEGVDMNDLESIKTHIHLFQPRHYLFPFLEHALGSLVGAMVAAFIAATHKMTFALAIGAVHLLGGIAAAFMIPAPAWFIVLDLGVAYLPMAWIGGKVMARNAS